ncbi:MAG: ATPase, partial [Desulfobacterales bacterium]|nr:ATPase [Desulfobacterales bacterium]
MLSLETLKKKIKTTKDLLSVVRTMKSLAAVNIRQYEGAVVSLEHYSQVVDIGWQALFQTPLRMLPAGD